MQLIELDQKQSKKLFRALLMRRLALLFIPTLFLAVFMGAWLGTWAAVVTIVAVIVRYYRIEDSAVKSMLETAVARQNTVCSLLSEHVDYFNVGKTIVAVNINEGKIAFSLEKPNTYKPSFHPLISILKGTPKINMDDFDNFVINVSSLKNWSSSETIAEKYIGQKIDVTQFGNHINVNSRADTQSIDARMINQNLQIDAANRTGLYIHTTDLAHASLFVRMDMKTANTWVLLLQKLVDGELPAVDSPQQIGG